MNPKNFESPDQDKVKEVGAQSPPKRFAGLSVIIAEERRSEDARKAERWVVITLRGRDHDCKGPNGPAREREVETC